ncbi:MAG TPA: hypothetical protein VIM14_09805 [Polyangia bacterium]|jgi:hypothetical protein
MPLVFEEVHAAPDKKKVNEEFFVLSNQGASAVSTAGLQVIVGRPGKRGSVMGQIDPGFVLQPGEKILILSGIPGKQSQGEPPVREGMRTYYLFQREGLLKGRGTTVRFALNQIDVARVTYDISAPNGLG